MRKQRAVIESNKREFWEASDRCAVGIGGGKQGDVRKETAGFTAVMLTNLDCVSEDPQPLFTGIHSTTLWGKQKIDKRKERKEINHECMSEQVNKSKQ